MVAPRGKGQQGLGVRVHGVVQQQMAQLLGQRRSARLTGQGDGVPRLAQGGGQGIQVRGFARAINASKLRKKPVLLIHCLGVAHGPWRCWIRGMQGI